MTVAPRLRRALALVALLLVGALAAACGGGSGDDGAARPDPGAQGPRAGFVGANGEGPFLDDPRVDVAAELRRMREAGVRRVRVPFYWLAFEPEEPAGAAAAPPGLAPAGTRKYDRIVRAASAADIEVVPVVLGTPAWAAADPEVGLGSRPTSVTRYAAFVGALVERYGPGGRVFGGAEGVPIRRWQIWNEPNYPQAWSGKPWPRTYGRLLRAAAEEIRRRDRGALVYMAALTNDVGGAVGDAYDADIVRYADVVAIQPFTARPVGLATLVGRVRDVMRENDDPDRRLALTEFSWTSADGRGAFDFPWSTDDAGQGRDAAEALRLLGRLRSGSRIDGVYWFTWLSPAEPRDAPGERAPSDFQWAGLRESSGARVIDKPALSAFSRAAREVGD